jgi:hypothetical protein
MARAQASPSPAKTLRAKIEDYRSQGGVHSVKEAVGIIVPLAVELANQHAQGALLLVHPSSITRSPDGAWHVSPVLARTVPVLPRDRACLAPEERDGRPGNARSSVFAIGAMLYELLTGESVGPGMRRPTEVLPTLPPDLDAILAKALVGDPAHRPDDLKALAQAIHHLSPMGSVPPPEADESHLDHGSDFEVDVSMSMVPPMRGASGYAVGVREAVPQGQRVDTATGELTELKERLESDPRPRYVVIKDGMDHGPFNAVELLMQIANHTFNDADLLRDTFSSDERTIGEWNEFAPFAEHARRHRDIAAEKVAIQATVEKEKKTTQGKALLGLTLVGVLLIAGAAWFLTQAGIRKDSVAVQDDTVTNVEAEGNLNVPKSKGGGRRVVGSANGIPLLGGGMSCEAAQNAYVEEIKIGGGKVAADITGAQYAAVLNTGSYLNGCGLPSSMSVSVCAAVQNGRAVGVTVVTNPRNGGVASCIAGRIRGMSFPSHPKLDVTRTTFAAQ